MSKFFPLKVGQMLPDLSQPRKDFDPEALQRLADSIAARGLFHPIRVMRDKQRDAWVIVTGESRWRAAMIAGLEEVDCIEVDGPQDEATLLADRIVENAVRVDLRPLDMAHALSRLKRMRGWNSQQLAKETGLSAAAITRAESLLTLPEEIQALVDSGAVAESTAYELSRMPDPAAMHELAQAVAAKQKTRQDVIDAVQKARGRKATTAKPERLAYRLGNGISVTVLAGETPTRAALLKAAAKLRQEAEKLKPAAELAVDPTA